MSGDGRMLVSSEVVGSQFVPNRLINPVGLSLLLFAGLNLNAVAAKYLGQAEMLSPIAFILTMLLIVQHGKFRYITPIYTLFSLTMISYIIMGSIPELKTLFLDYYYIKLYLTTFILVSALYFWIMSVDETQVSSILTIFKYLTLVMCVATIFSSTLQQFEVVQASEAAYSAQMEDQGDRATGFFENPNQAAAAALYCLVMVIAMPARNVLWKAVQCAIALVALVMTFSKGAMLGALVLTTAFLLTRRSLGMMVLVASAAAAGIFALWFVYEHDLFRLSWDQRERLADVLNLAGGEVSARTTTGRTGLLEFGLEKIKEVFPWGAGLGELHAMEGGLRKISNGIETNRWLGVHNTFLTFLGESGLIPFLMLLVFLAWPVIGGRKSKYRGIIFGFTMILIIQMFAGHEVFLQRFTDATIAITMAVAALAAREKVS